MRFGLLLASVRYWYGVSLVTSSVAHIPVPGTWYSYGKYSVFSSTARLEVRPLKENVEAEEDSFTAGSTWYCVFSKKALLVSCAAVTTVTTGYFKENYAVIMHDLEANFYVPLIVSICFTGMMER